jgi:hypothetical protein
VPDNKPLRPWTMERENKNDMARVERRVEKSHRH